MSKKIWILLRKSQYSKAMVGKAMERNKTNKQTDRQTMIHSEDHGVIGQITKVC
jgi:hypothetical protein